MQKQHVLLVKEKVILQQIVHMDVRAHIGIAHTIHTLRQHLTNIVAMVIHHNMVNNVKNN